MVARVWILVLLLLPAPAWGGARPSAENTCLVCHPVHYAELGSCSDCHAGFPGTDRVDIAHSGLIAGRYAAFTLAKHPVTQRGEQRLKDYACRRCHVSDSQGNRLAADLDQARQQATPEELEDAIRAPVLFMPQFHFSEAQRIELVNAIFAGAQRAGASGQERPAVIHFEGEGALRELEFEKECGRCHRALTERLGGLGSGLIGPNLSGLLTRFYPQNFGEDNQNWTVQHLEKWLKNPRKIRPLTQMSPVSLKQEVFERLVIELQPTPEESALPP